MSDSLPQLQRGRILREQGRHQEAEAYFKEAIAVDPDSDENYSELALCLFSMEGRSRDALACIDDAISRAPDNSHHHAIRGLILSKLKRGKDALEAADRAIAIDPDHAFNYAVKADAYSTLERWADAEQFARDALELDPNNDFAANMLASLLRLQGKQWESEIAVDKLLASDPEDPYAHFNAGWSALQAHQTEKAEGHFREALRLDPEFDAAREGLLESFKARSVFYRIYLRYCFWMQRFTSGNRWLIIIGLYLAFRFGSKALQAISPFAAAVFVFAYLGFVFWVWLAPGIGSFLVMMDKSARYALKKAEKIEGSAVGGGMVVAVMAFGLGMVFSHLPSIILGVMLAASTVPAAMTFTNEQPRGRLLFGSVYFGTLGIALIAFVVESMRATNSLENLRHSSETMLLFALIACAACTWLGNVPALREVAD